ncbi:hypothetical protein LINGRAHAP2_LOCUS14332 [Linum grandiflorum]
MKTRNNPLLPNTSNNYFRPTYLRVFFLLTYAQILLSMCTRMPIIILYGMFLIQKSEMQLLALALIRLLGLMVFLAVSSVIIGTSSKTSFVVQLEVSSLLGLCSRILITPSLLYFQKLRIRIPWLNFDP